MFYPDQNTVLGDGIQTIKFTNKYETSDSPLASAIFKVKGVAEVLLASRHLTVTKTAVADWNLISPNIELVISQFYAAGLPVVKEGIAQKEKSAHDFEEGSVEFNILELLEEKVRPYVQQDGGDIEFDRFNATTGQLYLRMHGACSGCPKSNVTLQMGIKNLLEHYIPEVKEIVNVDEEEEVALPRAHEDRVLQP
jgi:Fe-S cluster biogenesis protein NfuA